MKPQKCFAPFTSAITEARRKGDVHEDQAIKADLAKIRGNSAYGGTLLNKQKQNDVKYVTGQENVYKKVNDPKFQKLQRLDGNVFEIESSKATINNNLCSYIGFLILEWAKMFMLSFHYDCIDNFCAREDYQLMEMDTDSSYLAISGQSLEAIVRPEKKREFYSQYNQWFPRKACDEHTSEFIENKMSGSWNEESKGECCKKAEQFDKRKPGLFKLECQGDGMVALASKTYCVQDSVNGGTKFSSKGIQKRNFKNPYPKYMSVLETANSVSGQNIGFQYKKDNLVTYSQERKALNYFYCKREVLQDGVSTKPLDIVLSPKQLCYSGQNQKRNVKRKEKRRAEARFAKMNHRELVMCAVALHNMSLNGSYSSIFNAKLEHEFHLCSQELGIKADDPKAAHHRLFHCVDSSIDKYFIDRKTNPYLNPFHVGYDLYHRVVTFLEENVH